MLFLLGVLVLLFREDWRIGLAMSVFTLVAFFVYNLTRSMAVPYYTAEREGYSRLYGFLEERLTGIEDIRTNGASGYILGRFFDVNRDTYRRVLRSEKMGAMLRSVTTVLFTVGHALAMGMGIWLYDPDTFTVGAVYLVLHYTSMLRMPLFMISRQINELQKATAGLKRIEALQRTESQIVDGDGDLRRHRTEEVVEPGVIAFQRRVQLDQQRAGAVTQGTPAVVQPFDPFLRRPQPARMGQAAGRLDRHRDPGRELIAPPREALVAGPAVETAVQFHGVELGGITGQASRRWDPLLVEHARPVVVRPSGGADANRHRIRVPAFQVSVSASTVTPSGELCRTASSRIRPRSSAVLNSTAISWAVRRPCGRSHR